MSSILAGHKWVISGQDRPRAAALAKALELPPIVAHLLLLRGIDTPEAGEHFLRPRLAHLTDPFSLTDMDRAVARVTRARDNGEHVLIFGDYDVDGIAATALLVNGFHRFGLSRVSHGMPLRLTEGYGLRADRVEAAKDEGVSLIVTVDNGISAHDAAARARELGIDLLVTDHHAIEGTLPEAVAVVNPKREAPEHPCFHLCGAGVAFKLSTALNGTPNDLDIAALGTVADIVPLQAENRVIVALGLRHMARHGRLGLAKLAEVAGVRLSEVTAENIGFQLGPRINAAGRLDDGRSALRLLLSDAEDEAAAMADTLDCANEERRAIEHAIFEEAIEELDACFENKQRAIVLARREWHAGVIGIVASRLQSRYNRPVVLIAIDADGTGRGSARSPVGFDMIAAIGACRDLLVQFGGHRSAAGLTIEESHVPDFQRAFEAQALEQLGPGPIVPELSVDVLAAFSEIDAALLKALDLLEPIGNRNPAPVFASMNVELVPQSTRVYKDRHIGMALRQNGAVFNAIGFNMAERFYTEETPHRLDVAYTPQFNYYRGDTSIQLVLRDMRPACNEE